MIKKKRIIVNIFDELLNLLAFFKLKLLVRKNNWGGIKLYFSSKMELKRFQS